MSRKKPPGPALTIEVSVPGDSRSTEVTNSPPSLLTSALKKSDCGLFVLIVVVTRNDSPVMLKTGDCLFPLPLVVLTILAPGHSESAPLIAVVPVVVPVVLPVVPVVVVVVVVCPHAGNANTKRKVRAANITRKYGTNLPLLVTYHTSSFTIAYRCKQCNVWASVT